MICTVVGARPNFVKMAPILHELQRRGLPHLFVHTGQHYDQAMSGVFFDELSLPQPDVSLGVGSGSHAWQTAGVMTAFEPVLLERKPDLVLVAGDVNSTLACALTAAKLHIPVGHVESGLRSFDRRMPEELNRVLTDHLAELLFVTEPSGEENLAAEGIDLARVHFVGNTMIDTLERALPAARKLAAWERFNLPRGGYALTTLHRPANVDDRAAFAGFLSVLESLAGELPVLFPAHPRSLRRLETWGLAPQEVQLIPPLGYLEFLSLMSGARLVLTDSGGIQEETTALGVPCLTLRENTERPVTISQGTNRLAGTDPEPILQAAAETLADPPAGRRPERWDGNAAVRLVDVLAEWLARRV